MPFDRHAAVRHLKRADEKLGAVIERVGPCTLAVAREQSPFEALAESIVYQQLTGKAAATILSRVVALYAPKPFPSPEDLLVTPDERLRGAGLSGSKTAALKDLARKTLDGVVPDLEELHAMHEDAIVERLTQVRGIGRWTVEMMLIFRLGRPDVLPVTDYGVRKGFMRVFRTRELPDPKKMFARAEAWRPYRSVAAWYLWRAIDTVTQEKPKTMAKKAPPRRAAVARTAMKKAVRTVRRRRRAR